jgi:hypothetical protein
MPKQLTMDTFVTDSKRNSIDSMRKESPNQALLPFADFPKGSNGELAGGRPILKIGSRSPFDGILVKSLMSLYCSSLL